MFREDVAQSPLDPEDVKEIFGRARDAVRSRKSFASAIGVTESQRALAASETRLMMEDASKWKRGRGGSKWRTGGYAEESSTEEDSDDDCLSTQRADVDSPMAEDNPGAFNLVRALEAVQTPAPNVTASPQYVPRRSMDLARAQAASATPSNFPSLFSQRPPLLSSNTIDLDTAASDQPLNLRPPPTPPDLYTPLPPALANTSSFTRSYVPRLQVPSSLDPPQNPQTLGAVRSPKPGSRSGDTLDGDSPPPYILTPTGSIGGGALSPTLGAASRARGHRPPNVSVSSSNLGIFSHHNAQPNSLSSVAGNVPPVVANLVAGARLLHTQVSAPPPRSSLDFYATRTPLASPAATAAAAAAAALGASVGGGLPSASSSGLPSPVPPPAPVNRRSNSFNGESDSWPLWRRRSSNFDAWNGAALAALAGGGTSSVPGSLGSRTSASGETGAAGFVPMSPGLGAGRDALRRPGNTSRRAIMLAGAGEERAFAAAPDGRSAASASQMGDERAAIRASMGTRPMSRQQLQPTGSALAAIWGLRSPPVQQQQLQQALPQTPLAQPQQPAPDSGSRQRFY